MHRTHCLLWFTLTPPLGGRIIAWAPWPEKPLPFLSSDLCLLSYTGWGRSDYQSMCCCSSDRSNVSWNSNVCARKETGSICSVSVYVLFSVVAREKAVSWSFQQQPFLPATVVLRTTNWTAYHFHSVVIWTIKAPPVENDTVVFSPPHTGEGGRITA